MSGVISLGIGTGGLTPFILTGLGRSVVVANTAGRAFPEEIQLYGVLLEEIPLYRAELSEVIHYGAQGSETIIYGAQTEEVSIYGTQLSEEQ